MIRLCIPSAALALAALSAASAAPAAAQSLLSARALGYTLEPIDARSRALGYAAVGLPEPELSLVNPAAAAGLPVAGLSVTFQSDQLTATVPGQGQDLNTARFPALQVGFPVGGRTVVTLGYASLLDQNWTATRNDSVTLAGERRLVEDRFVSRGGVSRLRAGAAYRLMERLDVGVGLDLYTGAARDSALRSFPDGGLFSTAQGTTYEWRGLGASAGARYRAPAYSLAASVTAAGNLTAEPTDSAGEELSYSLPLMLDAGGSARVSQNALLVGSFRWSSWSAANDELSESGGARDAMQAGLGLEYEALRFLGRPLPVRLGARWAQLPFRFGTEGDFPEERAITGGLGIVVGGGAGTLDLTGERGMRGSDAAGLEESFWRVSLSMRLLGR